MALELIDYPTSLTDQDDFSAHGDLIEAGYQDKVNSPLLVRDGVIPQGAVLQVGGVIYQGTSDTAITGTASDYVRITAAGAAATAEYVATLTGVEWSKQYNGYYDGAVRLYLFDEGKALAAGAIAAVFGRYVTQRADGSANIQTISNDLTVTGTLGVGGIDTFGGFHEGTSFADTVHPIGSIVLAVTPGTVAITLNDIAPVRRGNSEAYTVSTDPNLTLLEGTWRSRGRIAYMQAGTGDTTSTHLMQRTA